ncbi:MAG: alpha/beta fold hydrolase [Phycisphaerales bacterium]|nr:alpha/beta fold hydrolase [Phycisphaerales bacterium]
MTRRPRVQVRSLFAKRWFRIYIVLLLASQCVQLFWPRSPRPGLEHVVVNVAAQADGTAAPDRDVRLAYRRWGDAGEPIILLHGTPGSSAAFTALAPRLAENHLVIAPDLPGFGASSRWIPDYGIDAHAGYTLALMDAIGCERAHIVGFSMGAGAAIHMAHQAPDRVASLTLLNGLGVQEGEGSGDYHFEHLKYALAYAGLVVAPELIPHFGLLGERSARHSSVRNFWDTDQRPIRDMLTGLSAPLLILHGRDDFLVPLWTAEEHHRIVEQSRLVIFDAGHFMTFSDDGAALLADEILPFVAAADDADALIEHDTIDYSQVEADEAALPVLLDLGERGNPWAHLAVIAVATFFSEDLTCVTVGMLIHRHDLDPFVGVLGCFIGIFMGDLGLWLLGRVVGRRMLRWKRIERYLPTDHLDRWGTWFDKRGWVAVLASRCLPGTRIPTFVGAGIVGHNAGRFALWALLAGLLWTPALVMLAAIFGPIVARPFEAVLGTGLLSTIVALLVLFILIRLALLSFTSEGRARLVVRFSRIWRREFWPAWVFYAPLVPWMAYLSLRHHGMMLPTAANPGIPDGGIIGESKHNILTQLRDQQQRIIPYALIHRGKNPDKRAAALQKTMQERGWDFPIILKPDVAQRGVGLKLIHSIERARDYFATTKAHTLAQVYDTGPYEAGIMYCRLPGESRGRIFSITDKVFPEITGDGKHTLRQLIWRHPRYRMQAKIFMTRLHNDIDRVLDKGKRMAIGIAGNHCQGALLRDGAHLITPALEDQVERIARSFPQFDFGRLDVRYRDVDKFMAGEDMAIIEFNGALSESTNIYDPAFSVFRAYRILFEQWAVLYRIGAANRDAGQATASLRSLIRAIVKHYRSRTVSTVSD